MSPFRRLIYKTIAGFSIAVGAGTTFYFLRQNDYEVSHLGIIRFARVGTTASSIFVDYKWSLWNLDPNLDEYKKQMKGCHQRSAEKLLNLAKANGGVFIKVSSFSDCSSEILGRTAHRFVAIYSTDGIYLNFVSLGAS